MFFLYCNRRGERVPQERKTKLGPLHCIQLFFFFPLNTWDFIFKASTLNWKNRLESYWRRNPDISLSSLLCKFYHPGKQVLVTVVQEPTGVFYKELVRISFGKAGHRPHLALINSLYWMQQFCIYLPFTLTLQGATTLFSLEEKSLRLL